ncbi:hypothetical protein SK128_021639, partial [Halocaridina rubra]
MWPYSFYSLSSLPRTLALWSEKPLVLRSHQASAPPKEYLTILANLPSLQAGKMRLPMP